MSEDRDYKSIVIPCKVCAREFEYRCLLAFYEAATADGPAEFTGTCPDCAVTVLASQVPQHPVQRTGCDHRNSH